MSQEIGWDPDQERLNLAQEKHDGYIWAAAKKLRPKLPLPQPDWVDLKQEMYIWALEAIDMYDPRRSTAKFTTFLTKHLSIRSMQHFNWSWWAKNSPRNSDGTAAWVYSFGQLASDGEKANPLDFSWVRDVQVSALEFGELKDRLTERSKALFEFFSTYVEWEESVGQENLVHAFADIQNAKAVAKLVGLEVCEVEQFISEVRKVSVNTCNV